MGGLLARDWLALVAVEAFVDTARGGGIRGGATIKRTSTASKAPLRRAKQRAEVAGSCGLSTITTARIYLFTEK